MADQIQMVDCNCHLGDNPEAFPGTEFVGLRLQAPLAIPDPAKHPGHLFVRIETSNVETLGGAQHRVLLGGTEIGRIVDPTLGPDPLFEFPISRELAEAVIASGNPTTLTVEVDDSVGAGLADDFVVRRYGTRVTGK